jgi:hypothetical protein
LVILQRLATLDPQNSDWQRDLFVSHWKLLHHAQAMNDPALRARHYGVAYAVLQRMVAAVYEEMKAAADTLPSRTP